MIPYNLLFIADPSWETIHKYIADASVCTDSNGKFHKNYPNGQEKLNSQWGILQHNLFTNPII